MAHLRRLHGKYNAELARHTPGPDRARALHRLMNEEIDKTAHIQISCQKGCGDCCHLEVEITRDEGELLAQVVLDGHSIDRGHLETQAARERKSPDWYPMLKSENRCVFLGADNACSVYEHRPSICRKHLVVSPAAECSSPGGNPHPVNIPLADLILSTALSLPDNPFASLSKSLKAGLDKFEPLQVASRRISADLVDGDPLLGDPLEAPAIDMPYSN